jgi:hypothetical protein
MFSSDASTINLETTSFVDSEIGICDLLGYVSHIQSILLMWVYLELDERIWLIVFITLNFDMIGAEYIKCFVAGDFELTISSLVRETILL